jgi:hypothetical protein
MEVLRTSIKVVLLHSRAAVLPHNRVVILHKAVQELEGHHRRRPRQLEMLEHINS